MMSNCFSVFQSLSSRFFRVKKLMDFPRSFMITAVRHGEHSFSTNSVVKKTSGAFTLTPVAGSTFIGGCLSQPGFTDLISSKVIKFFVEVKPPVTRVSRKEREESLGCRSCISVSPAFGI